MTQVQKILTCLADCLHDNQISEDECLGALKALRGIPAEKHMDAFMAFIGADQDQQEPEEQPEDYAVVKTFDSSIFHIGDEIVDTHGVKGLFAGYDDNGLVSIIYAEGCVDHWKPEKWHRTGRNFPAIPAILEELKKA